MTRPADPTLPRVSRRSRPTVAGTPQVLPISPGRELQRLSGTETPALQYSLPSRRTGPATGVFGIGAAPVATPRPLAARLELVSRRRLGVRFKMDPLGEGPEGTVDRDPLKSWSAVDCFTFMEQCLAEALAPAAGPADDLLRRIRYRDGVVSFETRNHDTVADWLPANEWCAADITSLVGGAACRTMAKTVDRAAVFRRRGGDPAAGGPPHRLATRYIPRDVLPRLQGAVPSGSMLVFVQDRPGTFAMHCALVFARGDGSRFIRHASQFRGRVLEEPLAAYLARASKRVVGAMVIAFRHPGTLALPTSSPRSGRPARSRGRCG